MLFGAQRKLHHPLQELIGGQADEIAQHEFLGVEADEVTQLQGLASRAKTKSRCPLLTTMTLRPISNFERQDSPGARSNV
jgi:hypothetical protein